MIQRRRDAHVGIMSFKVGKSSSVTKFYPRMFQAMRSPVTMRLGLSETNVPSEYKPWKNRYGFMRINSPQNAESEMKNEENWVVDFCVVFDKESNEHHNVFFKGTRLGNIRGDAYIVARVFNRKASAYKMINFRRIALSIGNWEAMIDNCIHNTGYETECIIGVSPFNEGIVNKENVIQGVENKENVIQGVENKENVVQIVHENISVDKQFDSLMESIVSYCGI